MQTAPMTERALTSSWSITPTAIAAIAPTANVLVTSPTMPMRRDESTIGATTARTIVADKTVVSVRELQRARPAVQTARARVAAARTSSTLAVQLASPATEANTNIATTRARTPR